MIRFWRPGAVDWGNAWPAEEGLNELLAQGWKIVAVLPADRWSQEVPTVVLGNSERWCCRFHHRKPLRWYERLWNRGRYAWAVWRARAALRGGTGEEK